MQEKKAEYYINWSPILGDYVIRQVGVFIGNSQTPKIESRWATLAEAEKRIKFLEGNKNNKEKDFSIEGKCIGCYDTGIINKGTSVEEPCPICKAIKKKN